MCPERVLDPSQVQTSVPVVAFSFGSWNFSIGRTPYTSRELAEHYDDRSASWQETIEWFGFEGAYRHLICQVLRHQKYQQSGRSLKVLDAGIGTGAMSSAFRAEFGQGFQLEGVDISEEMLREAAKHLNFKNLEKNLVVADITDLPFGDDCFDVVLVAHVVEHLAAPEIGLKELYRVLKPGGLLICSMTRRSAFGMFVQLLWRTHQVSMSRALGWLRGAGFEDVRALPMEKGSAARSCSIGYAGRK